MTLFKWITWGESEFFAGANGACLNVAKFRDGDWFVTAVLFGRTVKEINDLPSAASARIAGEKWMLGFLSDLAGAVDGCALPWIDLDGRLVAHAGQVVCTIKQIQWRTEYELTLQCGGGPAFFRCEYKTAPTAKGQALKILKRLARAAAGGGS